MMARIRSRLALCLVAVIAISVAAFGKPVPTPSSKTCSSPRASQKVCASTPRCSGRRVVRGRVVCVRLTCRAGRRLNTARTRCVPKAVRSTCRPETGLSAAGNRCPSTSPAALAGPTFSLATQSDTIIGNPIGEPPALTPIPVTPPPTPGAQLGRPIAPLRDQVLWGVWSSGSYFGIPAAPYSMLPLDDFEVRAGKRVSIVHWAVPWFTGGAQSTFPTALASAVRSRGAIPLIDWYSRDDAYGRDQDNFRLSAIAAGRHDGLIRAFAVAARTWRHPVFLSLDPEMNGNWPVWSELANGNAPGDFVKMWRHVHAIFEEVGATNVTWVWQVNAKYSGSIPIATLYPGDDQVDWVGISGYGWGTHPDRNVGWRDFNTIFSPILSDIASVAPRKPVMIAETGASEYGGSKADWIADAFTVQVPRRANMIRAIVWFNSFDYPYDWSIQSSPAAQDAFSRAISSPLYSTNDFGNLS